MDPLVRRGDPILDAPRPKSPSPWDFRNTALPTTTDLRRAVYR